MTGSEEKRPLRVVRIIDRLIYGGPTRNVVFLTEGLSKLGFECELVTGVPAEGERDMASWAQQYQVEPRRLKEMSRELCARDAVVIWKLWRLFKQLRPDIVHTHKSKAGATGRIAAFLYRYGTPSTLLGRPKKILVLHTFHGHIFHSYYSRRKTWVFIQIERLLARLTDCIVTVSEQQKEEIQQVHGVGKSVEFRVVPLGIDFRTSSSPARFRETHGIEKQEFLVGAVGRLCEIKNFSLLLRALALARRSSAKPPIRLAFIGDGHLRPELEAETRELGISDSVDFTGFSDDVDAIYPELDLAALSSLNEGTPLVLIEAMSHGRPVMTTEVGGYRDILGEFVRAGEGFKVWAHGVSVGSGDVEGYANALLFFLTNRSESRQMGERGRGYAWQRFSRDRLVEDMAGLYRELWARRTQSEQRRANPPQRLRGERVSGTGAGSESNSSGSKGKETLKRCPKKNSLPMGRLLLIRGRWLGLRRAGRLRSLHQHPGHQSGDRCYADADGDR